MACIHPRLSCFFVAKEWFCASWLHLLPSQANFAQTQTELAYSGRRGLGCGSADADDEKEVLPAQAFRRQTNAVAVPPPHVQIAPAEGTSSMKENAPAKSAKKARKEARKQVLSNGKIPIQIGLRLLPIPVLYLAGKKPGGFPRNSASACPMILKW